MHMLKKLFHTIVSLALLFGGLLPGVVRAEGGASLKLSPGAKTVSLNQEFNVDLVLVAVDPVNSAEVTLRFPTDRLSVVSVSSTGSVITVWAAQPTFSNTNGTVSFAGGRTSSFRGSGKLVTVRFKALRTGDAAVWLGEGQVLLADGTGLNVLATFDDGRYSITNERGYLLLNAGDLVKLPDDSNPETQVDTAVYYYGVDGLRYVFPNDKTYFTWYTDFSNVKEIGAEQLGTIRIGGNATYRPGTRMVKIQSDPRVFVVERGGVRRHIPSEAVARALYGSTWNQQIDDVPDSFFSHYSEGTALAAATTWTTSVAMAGATTIATDRGLIVPVEVSLEPGGMFTPATVTASVGQTVRFKNNTNLTARIASNPHPIHTGLPGFDSANMPPGSDYVYRFTRAGSFGFHNHSAPTNTGTVTVQ